jgi:hypothetical protein
MMQNDGNRIPQCYGVHFSQFQCNTIIQLNTLGIAHVRQSHLNEANDCFRSALLVFKRLKTENYSDAVPVELKDSSVECEERGDRSPLTSYGRTSEMTFKDASFLPPRPTATSSNAVEVKNDLGYGLMTDESSCILQPIELKIGHFTPFVEVLSPEKYGTCHFEGMLEDFHNKQKERFSMLVMMILIFNLGVVMQTKANVAADERTSGNRLHILNCALRLYRCVYDSLLTASQQPFDDGNEGYEDNRVEGWMLPDVSTGSMSDNSNEVHVFFARFHHMMLLCMLHNMGLVLKQMGTRSKETSEVYQFLVHSVHQFRAEEDQMNINNSTSGVPTRFLDLLPSTFDFDLIAGCMVTGLNILSNAITAPSA